MELSTESESYGSYGVTKDSLKASQEDNLSHVPVLISDKWEYPQNQNPIGTEGNVFSGQFVQFCGRTHFVR